MKITIQTDAITVVLETVILAILFIALGKKFRNADPMEKPHGIMTFVLWAVTSVYNSVKDSCGEKFAKNYAPYILVLWCYIFFSNIISLFGITSPTSNLSVTLTLSIMTWCVIQYVELKYGGLKAYLHSFIEPIAVMLPMNIIGKFSTMVSMSLRLFGNILCGGIMMSMIYSFCNWISTSLIHLITGSTITWLNFMAPVLAPVLHAYFDVFSGFIQTLVFVTLSTVLVGNDIPDEIKKAD